MRTIVQILVGVFFFMSAIASGVETAQDESPSLPFPQHVEYAAGTLMPDHQSRTQLDDDVRAAYWRWKANYVASAGTEDDGHPRYRVLMSRSPSAATVSESQGYGMVIVALMAGEDSDARTIFDGLWEFSRDHPSESDSRLMDWHVPADESPEPGSDSSAFDGDCDIAYALLLADDQWGSDGRVDYRAAFQELAAAMMESTIGPDSLLPMLGDWVDPVGETYNQHTFRTSDVMPGHFRAFAAATGIRDWNRVIDGLQPIITSLQADFSPGTGLLPDFAVSSVNPGTSYEPAPPGFLEGPNDGSYYYNAGRDPWRIGTDAVLFGDPVSAVQARAMSTWIRESAFGIPQMVRGGYRLDGSPIGNYFSSFFAAPFGVAAMVDPDAQQWLNAVYDAVKGREEGYYEDSVTLLCMLVMTGNFWAPEPPAGSDDVLKQPSYLD